MTVIRTLVLSGVGAAALATQAHAGGFYLQEQGVRGTGRAYSGEVADQGPASLWWNPAAIASSPREAYVGASGVLLRTKVTDEGSTKTFPGGVTFPVGGEPRAFNPIRDGVVPNFAASMPIGDRFAVGLSLAAPFNFITNYSPRSWARYDALHTSLNTGDLQLTGAMKVNDWLDIGVGADAQYTQAKLSTAVPNLSPRLPDAIQQLSGDGWNYGWTAGAQVHFDRLSLGASYRSSLHHDLSGRVFVGGLLGPLAAGNTDTSGTASFKTPWIFTMGARYRVTDKLTLDAQAQRFGWSEFDAIRVKTGAGAQTLAQDYQNTNSGGVGLDYALNDRLTLRAGVQYDTTPTPNAERSARVPDGDRWLFGFGATSRVGKRIQIDASLAYIDFIHSHVNHDTTSFGGTPAAITTALRGNVEGQGYILALGLRTGF